MSLTRFYDRQTGVDGPVSGALVVLPVTVAASGATTPEYVVNLPAGMSFQVTDVLMSAAVVTATPTIGIGDTASATAIVNTTTFSSTAAALTVADGAVAAGDIIKITITSTASDRLREGNVTIVGYVSSPPTSVGTRPA